MTTEELTYVLDGAYSPWQTAFEIWPSIQALGVKPFKDGDQWCFLYGDNVQDGIAGFGDTIRDAAVDFYNNLCYEKNRWPYSSLTRLPEVTDEEIEEMVTKRSRSSGTTKSEMAFYRNGIKDAIKRFGLRPSWKLKTP